MRIKQISVNGLFGIFDHVIPLNIDERITIIHGPNGFGKTAILRILNSFFNSQYFELKNIPFNKFRIEFDNNSWMEIIKNYDDLGQVHNSNVIFEFDDNSGAEITKPIHNTELSQNNNIRFDFFQNQEKIDSFFPKRINITDIEYPLEALERIIPGLERIAARKWLYAHTRETLSLEEILERFDHLLHSNVRLQEEPDWLKKLKNNIYIRLIESQRLLNFFPKRPLRPSAAIPSRVPTVSAYSDELAQLMQQKFKEYGTISQSLDRTFPIRVVKQQPSADVTDEQLRHQLSELEATRSRLIEVGLLDKEEDSEVQIQPQDIDESTKNALSVYVEDVERKLSVFAEIASKIELLKKIINNKFAYSYKEINFSKEKGFVFTTLFNSSLSNSKTLSPTDLSSGEQHELVLLYELLFKVQPNSLVLIDEPELSLHVGWQVQFLKDLREITQLADLDILMATHSPDIIQDRWDLTVELKGLKK